MAIIRHFSERIARLIDDHRVDGSPHWDQQFDGDRKSAEEWVRGWYGRAPAIERRSESTCFRYVGFRITVIEVQQ